MLIIQLGVQGACLVALDKKTGVERWRALDDQASYSAQIIIQQAGRRVLVCWTGENVVGLNPVSGKVNWGSLRPDTDDHQRADPSCFRQPTLPHVVLRRALMLKLRTGQATGGKTLARQGANERHTDRCTP